MAKSKKFRVAVAGATVDGREIAPQMLTEAVETFNPATYGVRVNVEHLRGLSGDKPFGMVGDVIALSTQEDTIMVGGRAEKRTALYAEIQPNERALELNKADQKVFSSIELKENFLGTGKFGLIGLALTDSPASPATERLQFSKAMQTLIVPPWENDGLDLKFDEEAPTASQTLFSTAINALSAAVTALTGGQKPADPPAPPQNPAQTPAPAGMEQFAAVFTAQTEAIKALAASVTESVTTLTNGLDAHKRDFAALKAELEKTPDPNIYSARPPVSGGGNKADAFVF